MPESTLRPQRTRRAGQARGGRFPRLLASLRLTLLGLLLLGVGGFAASRQLAGAQWLVIGSLSLLSLNLTAALLTNPVFRVRPALFGMHVGLLLLSLSLAFGQITRFRGHFEISEGEAFNPTRMIADRVGLISPQPPGEGAFVQAAVRVNYAPGLMRRETQSSVRLADGHLTEATDGSPLIIDGYRFYVTHNKGFSALVTWQPETGAPGQTGTLHFPSYPRLAPMQFLDWTAPDGTALRFEIRPKLHPDDDHWTLSREMAEQRLAVRFDNSEIVLAAGESRRLPGGGVLRFERIDFWLGYRVFYDPSLTWCFASALIAVCCLGLHLLDRRVRVYKRPASVPNGREATT